MKRIMALGLALSFFNLACYNTYYISKEELASIQSGRERSDVVVRDVEGEEIEISAESPLEVEVDGQLHRVTPFNFLLSDTQLVAPDYDLLLPADAVQGAQVRELSYGLTFGLIGGIVAAVGGGFALIAVFAE